MVQIYNIDRVGRGVEYWLCAGGLLGGEKQMGRIRNLEGANGGHIRVDWRSRGREVEGNVASEDTIGGRRSRSLEIDRTYENKGRGAGVCRCAEVRMRPALKEARARWLSQSLRGYGPYHSQTTTTYIPAC